MIGTIEEVRMFPKDVETVQITADDTLTALLDRADDHPLVLERAGVRYVLNCEDVGVYYDPEAVREAMRTAGTISPETAEAMIEAFEQSRGRPVRQPVGS
jgi:hypothetical protein